MVEKICDVDTHQVYCEHMEYLTKTRGATYSQAISPKVAVDTELGRTGRDVGRNPWSSWRSTQQTVQPSQASSSKAGSARFSVRAGDIGCVVRCMPQTGLLTFVTPRRCCSS